MEILMTTDRRYAGHLRVMLFSLAVNSGPTAIRVWLLSRDLTGADLCALEADLAASGVRRLEIRLIRVPKARMKHMPTSRRYPDAIYDRLFAADYLPEEVERVLYLDPDIVILNPLTELWETPMEGYVIAAASHVHALGCFFNRLRLLAWTPGCYINSGVMLMDLKKMREERGSERLTKYARTHRFCLCLPDQDILSAVYGRRILLLDPRVYNMTERIWRADRMRDPEQNLDRIRQRTAILHYIGRNKPWKEVYLGELDLFYREMAARMADAARNQAASRAEEG
ncbi:glycosyltransferase family 8 protein [Chordicoccus furentiruminis]|jgi:lipopolysaccharide biosynthesis glycosyltransferase|uniref:glycosyltransferase family 8 protein n=1 Tax=Chordicoccus furentiruminis TaxID=2709410 RepID=UPI0023A8BAD1|nr:glycosyltransferase family 8 protein [Chordicoccus furentiruminis]